MKTPSDEFHIGIIGGTGLGERLADLFVDPLDTVEPTTPFGQPSAGIRTGVLKDGTRLSLLSRHGVGHVLNPHAVPYRANIFALKSIGVTHIIASGAVGSLREHIHPGEVALVDQFIDRTNHRARSFFEGAAVHVEFAEPCCPIMRRWLYEAGEQAGVHVHEHATYVCMEGPAFSTRAESELHRIMGGDVVGMTAMPEAKLAREAEIAYALLALPTDYDCWRPHAGDSSHSQQSLLEEIKGNLAQAVESSVRIIRKGIENTTLIRAERSPAHDALALAIWSDQSEIPTEEVGRLKPIWGRYFASS